MSYYLKYRHPVTGNEYYFVDLCLDGDKLRPVGCFPYRRHRFATVFHIEEDVIKVFKYLLFLGYSTEIISVH